MSRFGAVAVLGLALGGCGLAGPAPRAPVSPPVVDVAPLPAGDRTPPNRTSPAPIRTFDEVRGLWVVRWSMTSPQDVRDMVEHAASAGFNTLIVQVRGRADAFYDSELEPRAETLEARPDFDPLALAIEEGHRRGLAVHAWVNTHLVWGPAEPPRSPTHLVNEHPDWLAVPEVLARDLYDVDPEDPRFVAALRRYAVERPRTVEGIFSSPSHPGVRDRVFSVWMDLVERYDLDGIHFDYIRLPSTDFDYSRGNLERFRSWVASRAGGETGRGVDPAPDPLALPRALPDDWADFQREQISSLVERIYRGVKERRPELIVSAAVVADAETAYGVRFQDWRRWLGEGILDVAVPMAYTSDSGSFRELVRDARIAAGGRGRMWAGIGAYLNTLEGTVDKIDIARAEGAGGVILFSYDWAASEGQGDPEEPFLLRVGRERFDIRR